MRRLEPPSKPKLQEAETKFVNHANMTIQEQVEIVKKKAGSQKRSFAKKFS